MECEWCATGANSPAGGMAAKGRRIRERGECDLFQTSCPWQPRQLGQVFRERFPIVFVPAIVEAFSIALGETLVVKNEFGSGSAVRKLELHNRVDARVPVSRTPCLHNSYVGCQLDIPPNDDAAKQREGAARFRTDLRGGAPGGMRVFAASLSFTTRSNCLASVNASYTRFLAALKWTS